MGILEQARIISFFERHIVEGRQAGWRVTIRKCHRLLGRLALLSCVPLAFGITIVVRALRPLVLIRFGHLASSRMGHFATNTELYLCEREAGMHPAGVVDIFYYQYSSYFCLKMACNRQLHDMWDRTRKLRVWQFASVLDRVNRLLPGGHPHVIPLPSDRDKLGLLARSSPHLSFTDEEERQGRIALRAMGVPEGNPFVCFYARDSAYLDTALPDRQWDYHDYRNSTIQNYVPAADELTRMGYFALRMGAIVSETLDTTNKMIIDYSSQYRSDFMDVFLGARCQFFIGDSAGINAVPLIFRRPVAVVNMVPLEYAPTWNPSTIFIPKKAWLRKEERFMTFREILESGVGKFLSGHQYDKLGIELVQNSPEEITALAVEMDGRLKRTWHETGEDKELQHRFQALFKGSQVHGTSGVSRIGTEYLRQHRALL